MILLIFLLITRSQVVTSVSNCVYDVDNGLKLDLRTLGLDHGRGPKFDGISNIGQRPHTLSWNGCFSYSKIDNGNCTDAAACYSK